jgi:hypothetical protein
MNRHTARLVGLLVLLALWGGCASTDEGAPNPALFPRAAVAPENRTPGRVAVLVRPQVQAMVHEIPNSLDAGVRLQVGRIVEESVVTALGGALRGGAHRLNEVPLANRGFAATLVIEAVRAEHGSERTGGVIVVPAFPIPFLAPAMSFYAHLAFDLSLLDAQGRAVWTHTYDGGHEIWKRPSFWSTEKLPAGMVRMAHETAWRLSQQAVSDLREWLVAERGKAREL